MRCISCMFLCSSHHSNVRQHRERRLATGRRGQLRQIERIHAWARGAALGWHEHHRQHLLNLRLVRGETSPCIVRRYGHDIEALMRGGDFVASGHEVDLQWSAKKMYQYYACTAQVLGFYATYIEEAHVLNRIVIWQRSWDQGMITYEGDPRLVEIQMKEFGAEDSKLATSPAVRP